MVTGVTLTVRDTPRLGSVVWTHKSAPSEEGAPLWCSQLQVT